MKKSDLFPPGRVALLRSTPPARGPSPRPDLAGCNWNGGAVRVTLAVLPVMFAMDDIDDTLVRLRKHGVRLVSEVVQYEDVYRLCYIRGPEGLLIGLAEHIG